MTVNLVLGGARSGKTHVAERLAGSAALKEQGRVVLLATAQCTDEEMAQRIRQHQLERPASWTTLEEPLEVATRLDELDHTTGNVVLVDCLSLLLNNWMYFDDPAVLPLEARMQELCSALVRYQGTVICVSNEVGQGIVPDNPLGREYRDLLGWMNQEVARVATKVLWVVAGIAVDLRRYEAEGDF